MNHKVPVVTLDGPSGTGKGTLCHLLAKRLGWHMLDSGVIYRALAWHAMQHHIALDAVSTLVDAAIALPLEYLDSDILLAGVSVKAAIRTPLCGQSASKIAVIPAVREALLIRQRAFAVAPGLVTDGRDMGTIVFPEADLKIYLDASLEARALRRYLELKRSGKNDTLAQVVRDLAQRDLRDKTRIHAPLVAAHDAVIVDTTDLSVDAVFEKIWAWVLSRGFGGESA